MFMVNVGTYTVRPMDAMRYVFFCCVVKTRPLGVIYCRLALLTLRGGHDFCMCVGC